MYEKKKLFIKATLAMALAVTGFMTSSPADALDFLNNFRSSYFSRGGITGPPRNWNLGPATTGKVIGSHGLTAKLPFSMERIKTRGPDGYGGPNGYVVYSSKLDQQPFGYHPEDSDLRNGFLTSNIDSHVGDNVTNGWEGQCDIIRDEIKTNSNLSAAEKFDLALKNTMGFEPGLASHYREYGDVSNADGARTDCGWASAALDSTAHMITSMERIYGDVPFGREDMMGLTTYVYPNPDSEFYGKRNFGSDTESSFDNLDLHTLFMENIGPGKPGIVMDLDSGSGVKAHPFFEYTMFISDSSNHPGLKDFIPSGGSAVHVTLRATYATATPEDPYNPPGKDHLRRNYWLITDKDENIVGMVPNDSTSLDSDKLPEFGWVPNRKKNSGWFMLLKKMSEEGIPVQDIEKFCSNLAEAFASMANNGNLSAAEKQKLQDSYKNIAPAVDANRLDALIGRHASTTPGLDYSEMSALFIQ